MNKFAEKAIEAAYLEKMYNVLEQEMEYITTRWGETGEVKQKTKWNSETREDEPVFNDDGEPVMYNVTGRIPRKPEEYDEDDHARVKIIKGLMAKLEKLM